MKQDYLEKQDNDFLEKIDRVFDTIIFDLNIFVDKKEDNLQDIVKQKIDINFKEDVISFEVAPCHLSILSYLISIVTLHKTFFLPLKGRRSDPSSCNLENNLDWYNENIKLYNELLQDEKAKAIIDYSIVRPSDDKYEIISDISDLFYIMHILESDENLCSLVVSLSKTIPVIFNKLHISPEEFGKQSQRITKYILYLDYVHYDGSMTTLVINESKLLDSQFLELMTTLLDEVRTLFEESYSNDNIQTGDNVVLNNGGSVLKISKFELSRENINNIIQNLSCLSLYGVLFLKLEFTFSYLSSKIDSNIFDLHRRLNKIMGKREDVQPLRRVYRLAILNYLTIQGKSSNDIRMGITLFISFVYHYSTKHLDYDISMFMDKVDALMNIYDSGEIERKLSNEAFEKVKSIFINPKVHEYIEILNKPGKISVSATPQEISSDSKDEKVSSVSEEKKSSLSGEKEEGINSNAKFNPDVTALDNSTCHGPAKLESDDKKTRYSKLREEPYYEQVKEFFSNIDIYDKSRHDEDRKDKKANYYDSELWEEIYYIATNVKNKTKLVGFMFILYESNCFNWNKMISILLEKMYNYYDKSDNAPSDFAFVEKSKMKKLERIFEGNEKPEWKAIRNHIQAMFNMMFMRKENYGKIKDNYKSNGKRYASTQFSKNTTMELFAQLFGYELNTKELEKIKESQKKTNEKRKGERKYVSPHKRTSSYDDNKLSSENTQSSYD